MLPFQRGVSVRLFPVPYFAPPPSLASPSPLFTQLSVWPVPLDVLGHQRAACAEAGVLGRRGHAVESAAARICREAAWSATGPSGMGSVLK